MGEILLVPQGEGMLLCHGEYLAHHDVVNADAGKNGILLKCLVKDMIWLVRAGENVIQLHAANDALSALIHLTIQNILQDEPLKGAAQLHRILVVNAGQVAPGGVRHKDRVLHQGVGHIHDVLYATVGKQRVRHLDIAGADLILQQKLILQHIVDARDIPCLRQKDQVHVILLMALHVLRLCPQHQEVSMLPLLGRQLFIERVITDIQHIRTPYRVAVQQHTGAADLTLRIRHLHKMRRLFPRNRIQKQVQLHGRSPPVIEYVNF